MAARGNESFRSRLGLMIACFFFALSYVGFVFFAEVYYVRIFIVFNFISIIIILGIIF